MSLAWLAAPLASIAGGLFGSHSAKKEQQRAAQLQLSNWIYQQRNAHQMEVEDLKKAGLNPILSATGGQIASIGAAPVAQDPGNFSQLGSVVANAMRLGMEKDLKLKDLEIQEKLAGIRKQDADTNARNAQTREYEANTGRLNAFSQFELNQSQIAFNAVRSRLSEAEIKKVNQDVINGIKITAAQVKSLEGNAAASYAAAGKFSAEAELALEKAGVTRIEAQRAGYALKNGAFMTYYLGMEGADKFKDDPIGFVLNVAKKQQKNVENHKGFFDVEVTKNPDWLKNLIGR